MWTTPEERGGGRWEPWWNLCLATLSARKISNGMRFQWSHRTWVHDFLKVWSLTLFCWSHMAHGLKQLKIYLKQTATIILIRSIIAVFFSVTKPYISETAVTIWTFCLSSPCTIICEHWLNNKVKLLKMIIKFAINKIEISAY